MPSMYDRRQILVNFLEQETLFNDFFFEEVVPKEVDMAKPKR